MKLLTKTENETRGELWIFRDGLLERQPVTAVTAEVVESGQVTLPRPELKEFVTAGGRRVWLAGLDLPAQIEAEQVRALRHSAILGSLFSEAAGGGNRIPLPFWILIFALVGLVMFK